VLELSEEAIIEGFKEKYSESIESAEILKPKVVSIIVKSEEILDIAETLRDEFGFSHPISGGAVDYPKESKMQMNYYLLNPNSGILIIYRVEVPRETPKIPTLTTVWEALSFHERETHEMFGIEFEGHPNMVPLLLPPDWKGGYPLRKDFKGEGVEQ
jgi:NADH:ubiquinone oxidoreductase subunit C